MVGIRRARATLGLDRRDVNEVLVRAHSIHAAASSAEAPFSLPGVSLDAIAAQIQALRAAQQRTAERHPGAATTRDGLRDALISSLEVLMANVQHAANAAPPEQSASIIEAAALKICAPYVRVTPTLGVKPVKHGGGVLLRADPNAFRKMKRVRFFHWQHTVDGGKTWISAAPTSVASTVIHGLPSMTTCGFRFSVVDSSGPTEWSQMVTLFIQ